MYLQDGYRLIKVGELTSALGALNERRMTFRAFRVYIACFEVLARREAAARAIGGTNRTPRFLRSELELLVDKRGERPVSRELLSLRKLGLMEFSETAIRPSAKPLEHPTELELLGSRGATRLVPVPRQVLKFLASCTRPALAKTIVAYLLRGLALSKNGELKNKGTVKISWICKLCKISERAARAARAELIRLGWITKDTGSFQRKLNRDGAYFAINVSWQRVLKHFAPLGSKKCTRSAPPKEKLETPYGSKNQKPASQAGSGICMANQEDLGKPTLSDIKFEDLRRLPRLRVLYDQAIARGWLQPSEANLRNFVGAAARATRVNGDAVRIFVGIVRKGLWHHLASDDEDRANRALKRERETCSRSGGQSPKVAEGQMRFLIDLAMRRTSEPVITLVKTGKSL